MRLLDRLALALRLMRRELAAGELSVLRWWWRWQR